MAYTVVFTTYAAKAFRKIPQNIQQNMQRLIEEDLAINPLHPKKCKKLKGHPYYKMRSGDYRVVYSIEHNQLIVQIIKIGHRRDVYKNIATK